MKKNLITLAVVLSLTACSDNGGSTGGGPMQPDTNTPATFAGKATASINNESGAISNTVTVSDVDGETQEVFKAQTNEETELGTFSITEAGLWTYEVDTENSTILALSSSTDTEQDTITITSADGTTSSIIITISGVDVDTPENNPAVITGTNSASIYHIGTSVTGTLSIDDIDSEAAFVSNTAADYGSFSISAAGLWTYDIDKANSDVSALTSGETLTDTITVTTVDGTTATVTITIEYGDSDTLVTPSLPSAVLNVPSVTCDTVYTSVSELEGAISTEMTAGTYCLKNGTYTDDLSIKFGGAGTEEAPIKIAAQTPGEVIFSGGEVKIQLGGAYAQLQGFVFEDILYGSKLIETRNDSAIENYCSNCRITEITVVNPKAKSSGGTFISVYGSDVWVDHNIFSGKTSANPMVSLVREFDDDLAEADAIAKLAAGTVVYGNYFANRAPAGGKMYANSGDNDYEAIRTGLSESHHYAGNSIIAGNLFENIQGEAEVISNKASNNVISNNTVRNSYGSITNRHGNTAVISNNFMFGDGYPFAGGLRIVDDGHVITNNYIEGARYKDTSHHGGIVIIGSDGSSDGGNGYQQVENVHIAHNTVVNSVNSVNIDGGGKSSQPKKVYFANNIVDKAVGDVFVDTDRGVTSDSAYTGNIVYGSGTLAETDDVDAIDLGATFVSAMLEKGVDGLYRPSNSSPTLTAGAYEKGEFADVEKDMDGTSRGDTTEVGADDINTDTAASAPLTYGSVGPQSYSYAKPAAIMVEADIANADFEDGLTSWTGGTLIDTSAGAFAGNALSFSDTDTAVQSGVVLTADSNYAISAFVKGTYSLSVNGHVFEDVIDSSDYKYVVHEFTTGATETSGTITLKVADNVLINTVDDSQMYNFKNSNTNNWLTEEDSDAGLGDVGGSSDGALSSNSARARFKTEEGEIHNFDATPGISQPITGVKTGVDLTYSLYYCDKKGDESFSTLYYGVKDASGTIIADARAHVSDLADAPKGTSKDCFRQVSLEIPSNTASEVEIFAFMEIDASKTDAEIYANEQYTDDELEIRVDEFVLSYIEAAPAGSEAMIDEVRVVKRTIDELSD